VPALKTVAAIAAAKKAGEAAAEDIYKNTTSVAKGVRDKLLVEFGAGFSKYLKRNYERCKFVKTLLHRVDPIPIDTAYVEPTIGITKKQIPGSAFLEQLATLRRVTLTALGGSGKSMFLKNTFLELCEKPFGRIPLFVELRDYNDMKDKNLLECILKPLSSLIPSFNAAQLEYGLSHDKFVVLLDGLDEVDFTFRDQCSKELLEITYRFPKSMFLVTSRPDDRFESWNEFYGAEILPLTEVQVIELLNKIDFDAPTKSRFVKEVKGRLFKSHKSFLSNPLLCTMMLMTYAEFEEIPTKMHIFYGRAFDALFVRHDRTKTGFRRKFYTSLAEDEFKRLFSTFCLLTFVARKFSFNESDAKKFIKDAINYEGLSVSADSFLKDLAESISILIREGADYSFLHRSFQEYFVAVFLAERQLPKMYALFDRIFNSSGDYVFALLFELNREAFEMKFFAEKVRHLRAKFGDVESEMQSRSVLSSFYEDISFEQNGISTTSVHGEYSTIEFLDRYYFKHKIIHEIDRRLEKIAELTEFEEFELDGAERIAFQVQSISPLWMKKTGLHDVIVKLVKDIQQLDEELQAEIKSKQDFVSEFLTNPQ
jgi:hypothetical protein